MWENTLSSVSISSFSPWLKIAFYWLLTTKTKRNTEYKHKHRDKNTNTMINSQNARKNSVSSQSVSILCQMLLLKKKTQANNKTNMKTNAINVRCSWYALLTPTELCRILMEPVQSNFCCFDNLTIGSSPNELTVRQSLITHQRMKCNVLSYMQKAGDSGDISPQFFLDFPQNFRLRTRNQYCTQAIAWGSTI